MFRRLLARMGKGTNDPGGSAETDKNSDSSQSDASKPQEVKEPVISTGNQKGETNSGVKPSSNISGNQSSSPKFGPIQSKGPSYSPRFSQKNQANAGGNAGSSGGKPQGESAKMLAAKAFQSPSTGGKSKVFSPMGMSKNPIQVNVTSTLTSGKGTTPTQEKQLFKATIPQKPFVNQEKQKMEPKWQQVKASKPVGLYDSLSEEEKTKNNTEDGKDLTNKDTGNNKVAPATPKSSFFGKPSSSFFGKPSIGPRPGSKINPNINKATPANTQSASSNKTNQAMTGSTEPPKIVPTTTSNQSASSQALPNSDQSYVKALAKPESSQVPKLSASTFQAYKPGKFGNNKIGLYASEFGKYDPQWKQPSPANNANQTKNVTNTKGNEIKPLEKVDKTGVETVPKNQNSNQKSNVAGTSVSNTQNKSAAGKIEASSNPNTEKKALTSVGALLASLSQNSNSSEKSDTNNASTNKNTNSNKFGPTSSFQTPQSVPNRNTFGPPQRFPQSNQGPPQRFPQNYQGPPQRFPQNNQGPPQRFPQNNQGPSQRFPQNNQGPPHRFPQNNQGPPQRFPQNNQGAPQSFPLNNQGPPQRFPLNNQGPPQRFPLNNQDKKGENENKKVEPQFNPLLGKPPSLLGEAPVKPGLLGNPPGISEAPGLLGKPSSLPKDNPSQKQGNKDLTPEPSSGYDPMAMLRNQKSSIESQQKVTNFQSNKWDSQEQSRGFYSNKFFGPPHQSPDMSNAPQNLPKETNQKKIPSLFDINIAAPDNSDQKDGSPQPPTGGMVPAKRKDNEFDTFGNKKFKQNDQQSIKDDDEERSENNAKDSNRHFGDKNFNRPPPNAGGKFGQPPPNLGEQFGKPPPNLGEQFGKPPSNFRGNLNQPPPNFRSQFDKAPSFNNSPGSGFNQGPPQGGPGKNQQRISRFDQGPPSVPGNNRQRFPSENEDNYSNSPSGNGNRSIMAEIQNAVTPLSNMPYQMQIEKKTSEVKDFLKRMKDEIVSANPASITWCQFQEQKKEHFLNLHQFKSSSVTDGYRYRCDFIIGKDPIKNKVTIGFLANPESLEVGPIVHLKHIPQRMKFIVRSLENFVRESGIPHFDPYTSAGLWMGMAVRMTKSDQVMVTISINTQSCDKLYSKNIKDMLRNFFMNGEGAESHISSLYVNDRLLWDSGSMENIYGDQFVFEHLREKEFRISPNSYFTVNSLGMEVMLDSISTMLSLHSECTLVDLCCGTGAIGLSLSDQCGQVLGLDILQEAIDDARINALNNNVTNCEYFVGSAEEFLGTLWTRVTFHEVVCVIDPPKAGLGGKAINHIRKNKEITKIVYIASSPPDALRNFIDLTRPPSNAIKGDPFIPIEMVPVDLYPHTNNYSVVILFIRVTMNNLMNPESVFIDKHNMRFPQQNPGFAPSQFQNLYGEATADMSWKRVEPAAPKQTQPQKNYFNRLVEGTPAAGNNAVPEDPRELTLSEEQRSWLNQMTEMYGAEFQRKQWVDTFQQQNEEAAQAKAAAEATNQQTAPAPLQYPNVPQAAPQVPVMQGYPGYQYPGQAVAVPPTQTGTSADTAAQWTEYSKQYAEYMQWYNQYGNAAAATATPTASNQPDTSSDAWKSYCEQMAQYWKMWAQTNSDKAMPGAMPASVPQNPPLPTDPPPPSTANDGASKPSGYYTQ